MDLQKATPDLTKYDIILLIDKSGSMGQSDGGHVSRWRQAEEAAIALAVKGTEFDDDGISVGIFNNQIKYYDNVDGEAVVNRIFQENEPGGGTDTAKALKTVIDKYLASKKGIFGIGTATKQPKPIIILVITDGEPDSKQDVIDVIVGATKAIQTEDEIGISFIQVGKASGATQFLKMLDDDLVSKHKAVFDIVDTKTCDEIGDMPLKDVLIAALTD